MNNLICRTEQRRDKVRAQPSLNGLDYLEVGDLTHSVSGESHRTLTVYFLGKAPVELRAENVRIEGGRRIRDVGVKSVKLVRTQAAEWDDYMEVITDKDGDFSPYTLRVVGDKDEAGQWQRHPALDARYDRIEFSFKVDCPSDLDCKPQAACPPTKHPEPELDYLAKDYASFRQLMFDRLAVVMPQWRERHVPDLGVTLVELLAYVSDHLSYYQDAVATEAYLNTARQRISVRRHARLVDYTMHEGCNARTWACVETDQDLSLEAEDVYFVTALDGLCPVATAQQLQRYPEQDYEIFESIGNNKIQLFASHNQIEFYTWDGSACSLVEGSTRATLLGRLMAQAAPQNPAVCVDVNQSSGASALPETSPLGPGLFLKPGDVLIFEEITGAITHNPADANPAHRHAVRLTSVKPGYDPVHPQLAITEIVWHAEDALPFPVCISSVGPAPRCTVQTVSVARGNTILVDHGQRRQQALEPVPGEKTVEQCDCTGGVSLKTLRQSAYKAKLREGPLTFQHAPPATVPAARALRQDVRQALPQIALRETKPDGAAVAWSAQRDLLESGASDAHFVVELDNEGYAHLRFGDGELGRRPEAGSTIAASYRIGNGPAGNVGREALSHMVCTNTRLSGAILRVRNPLPAVGGTAPEPMAEVKLMAPHAFRKRLERAITPADYAAIVMREFPAQVQRAAASLRWNGSWYEVLVVVDVFGTEEADEALLQAIEDRLYRYRRIGHDLSVQSAHRVPLKITLGICVLPGYLRAHVKAAVRDLLSNRRLSDGKLGFFHPDRLTFADGIYLSQLVAEVQAVVGVESVVVKELHRFHEPPNGELESGVLVLGPLEIARLDNDPSFPEYGLLELKMEGGR